MHDWFWINIHEGEGLPTEFISNKYPWVIYEKDESYTSLVVPDLKFILYETEIEIPKDNKPKKLRPSQKHK